LELSLGKCHSNQKIPTGLTSGDFFIFL